MRMKRREFLTGLASAGVAASMALPGLSRAASWKDPVLKIGYIPITDAAPLLIAHSKGMFQKVGIKTANPVRLLGWSELAMAFAHGAFNLCHLLSPIPLYLRYAKNIQVKVVAWDHVNNSAITVQQDAKIYDFKDLGGRSIAIPFWYSVHNVILQLGLRHVGLKPIIKGHNKKVMKDEVELFEMAPSDMVFALKNGAIDGYIVAEPYNAAGEMLYGGRVMRFSGDIWKNHACCQAAMHERDIVMFPDWAKRVVNVLVEAEFWLKNNIREAAMILSSDGENYIDLPYDVLLRAMTKYDLDTYGDDGTGAIKHPDWNIKRVWFEPFPFKSYTRTLVELLRETIVDSDISFLKKLDTEFIVNDIVDYELINKSLKKYKLNLIEGIDVIKTAERSEVLMV